MGMASYWIKSGKEDRALARHLAEAGMSRRALGRLVAGAAGMATLTPSVIAAAGAPSRKASAISLAAQPAGRGGTLTIAELTDNGPLDPYKTYAPLYWAFH